MRLALEPAATASVQRVLRCWPAPSPAAPGGQPDHERRREHPHRRVEQRVLGVEVAAHEVGAVAAAAVAEVRHGLPRRGVEQGHDRHHVGRRLTADGVLVAVGQHDHVALGGPVALAVGGRDPARAPGDDVEQDQPLVRPGAARRPMASGVDSNAKASVSSERKKIAPSRRSCSSAACRSVGDDPARRGPTLSVVLTGQVWRPGQQLRCLGHGLLRRCARILVSPHPDRHRRTLTVRQFGPEPPKRRNRPMTAFPPTHPRGTHRPRSRGQHPLVRGAPRRRARARRGHRPRLPPHRLPARWRHAPRTAPARDAGAAGRLQRVPGRPRPRRLRLRRPRRAARSGPSGSTSSASSTGRSRTRPTARA